jgi:hypothetical protein
MLRAVPIWNALGYLARPYHPPLDPLGASSLTNGDFSAEPTGHGFDWRTPAVPGVSYKWARSGVRIAFDGHQSDQCQTLEQYVPLLAGARCRLRSRYRVTLLPAGSGPRWRITDAITGIEIPSDAPPLSSAIEIETAARFRAPAHSPLARVALVYDRPIGNMRIKGSLALESVSLDFEP